MQDTKVSAPDLQNTDVAVRDTPTDSVEDSSHSQPAHPSELRPNSTAEDSTGCALQALPPTLPQVAATGCSLMEVSDDLITFDNGDSSADKHLGDDLPKVAPAGGQPGPSALSPSDTQNEPVASSEPAIVHRRDNETAASTDTSDKNLVDSVGTAVIDSPAEATPRADGEVNQESNIAPAPRAASVLESVNAPELPHEPQADQSPVPNSKTPNATDTLINKSEPMDLAGTVPQAPASDNKVTTVPEEFLIVAGLNAEQAPADPNRLPSANVTVANDAKSDKPLEPSQAGKGLAEDSPANPRQIDSSNLPAVTFPTASPAPDNRTTWSLNPTNRMSSSTEIVDPLLRSNIFNESVRETNLAATGEPQGSATEKIKTSSVPVGSKRTLRARSISGFFKLHTKKDSAKVDSAHSPTSTSIQSSDEDTRSFGKKGLPKRKSLSTLRRKSGLSWATRGSDEPVPPLPKVQDSRASNDPRSKHTSHSDEKLEIVESVESKNPPAANPNSALALGQQKQESKSEHVSFLPPFLSNLRN
jgi:hypothetical protein